MAKSFTRSDLSDHPRASGRTTRGRVTKLLAVLLGVLMVTLVDVSPAAAVPPDAPTAVTASNPTTTSIVVAWTDSGDPATSWTITPSSGAPQASAGSPHTFTGLTPGIAYTFTVVATNASSEVSTASASSNSVTTLKAPSAPSNVTVTPAAANPQGGLTVNWTASTGTPAPTYTVALNGVAAQNVGTATTATFSGLSANTQYTATVTATNSAGIANETAQGSTAATPAPAAPGELFFSGTTDDGTMVTWAPSATAGVTYAMTINGLNRQVVSSPQPITGLDPATNYTVRVVAVGAGGDSSASAKTFTTDPAPQPPDAPVITVGTVTEASISLSWTTPDGNGSAVTGYFVAWEGTDFATAANTTTLTGLTPGGTYNFSIVATNVNGTGPSDTARVRTQLAPQAFSVDSDVVLSGSSVRIGWTTPAANPAATYTVSFNPTGPTYTLNGTTATVSGMAPGVAYNATVTASNGVGANAVASRVITANAVPSAPGGTDATVIFDPVRVSVVWNDPANTGTPVTSFTIDQTAGPTVLEDIVVNVADVASNPNFSKSGSTYTYVIATTLNPGTYDFTVAATNAAGKGATAGTGTVAVPANPGPTQITAVNVAPLGNGGFAPLPFGSYVTITWQPPTDTGGLPISKYRIEMAGLVAETPAGARTATIGPLTPGDYNAKVQAFTAAGAGPVSQSNMVEVRAFPPFDTRQAFIRQQYRDFLGRTAEASGVAYWMTQTAANGSNSQEIIRRFMESPEFAPRRSVVRLYTAYFPQRDMDLQGFDFWASHLASRRGTVESVSQFFATSPEFQRTYGSLNNAQFVDRVYRNVLGRAPDPVGNQYWQGRLATGLDRGTLMTFFSESPENISRTNALVDVILTYRGMLNRMPDDQGQAFWVNRIKGDPNALANLIRGFFVSAEYGNRVTP